ncbi:DUF2206 domain-containing protein [Halapricum sp. CBA1109]|uniref:DUF2206 domain-containing protein n=1 Tax=Halapricum sp. CBA1109 TaxID=2668068 RepID=UPI0012FA297B|nr:DUF2206 domain-containing protein [Halapricum sp. CBA1109]MUV88599.1 DUF2206 domain-containing protein [Halapricum sp. CBA1109]
MTDPLQWNRGPGDGTVSIRVTSVRVLALAVTALVLIGALDALEGVGLAPPLVREVVGVVFLTFVPGTLLLLQFGYDGSLTSTVCYAFGLSISAVMAVGGVVSVLSPLVGFDSPLSLNAILVTWLLVSGVATWTARKQSFAITVDSGWLTRPIVPLLLFLVPLSILGSVFYHTSGNNIVLIGLLLGIAAIPILAAALGNESWYYPLAIWCLSLALLYHGRVPGVYTVTQPLPELTLAQLRWIPNAGSFGSLLANGVLFPTYAIVTDLPIGVEWNLVNPLLVSLLPVTLYEVFRRFVRPTEALVAVCLFVFSYPFYVLYPGAGRAATPVVFIALVGLAYSDSDLPPVARRALMLVFGAGIVVSHYGTAYVVLFSLLVGFVSFVGLSVLVRADIPSMLPDRYSAARSDGGESAGLLAGIPAVLSPAYLAFYSVFTLGWYIYTANSEKFVILPRKIIAAIEGVLYVEATGSTATSYTQNYAATTITVGKYFYVLLGLLMTIGIGAAALRLVVFHDESVELGYLAVAIGFFSMFVGSILPSGSGFAVARVMMIIFTFAVPFAVVGARELGAIPARIVGRLSGDASVLPDRSVSLTLLSVGVALFLC